MAPILHYARVRSGGACKIWQESFRIGQTSRAKTKNRIIDLPHRAGIRGAAANTSGFSVRGVASAFPMLDGGAINRGLLARLEAENAELRDRAVDLVLQIQLLRDGARPYTII